MVRRYRHRPNPDMRPTRTQVPAEIKTLELGFEDADPDDMEIRQAWRELYAKRLPEMARTRKDWPVYRDHCFARILLDNAVGRAWREVIPSPAWKNTPLPVLQNAIDLGEAVMTDDADIWALNDSSLIMRDKSPRGKVPASRPKWRRKPRRR